MQDYFDVKQPKLRLLAGMLYHACELGAWCFGENGDLYYTTCVYEKELKGFFAISGCLDYALHERTECDRPFLMEDSIGLVWVGEHTVVDTATGWKALIVIGPFFYSSVSLKNVENRLRTMNIPLPMRSSCLKILDKVPVLSHGLMFQYVKMLHYTVTGEPLKQEEILLQAPKEKPEETPRTDRGRLGEYERAYSTEQTLLQFIRDGGTDFQHFRAGGARHEMIEIEDFQTGAPLRESKDLLLIFTALCARTAIESGVAIPTAKEEEVSWIQKIERAKTDSELMELNIAMVERFAALVRKTKQNPDISVPIMRCCDYVRTHFDEPIDLKSIASEVGYTEYYLARKFQKEVGVRLLDYIKDVRLEYAKVWLISTEKSIQEISEQLQFGTRNYFSRIFREKTGMTPAQYRERVQARPEEQTQKGE
ncbi:MAG: AraC family transcriptional regulator [Eubacteriales bacterium]|nr:AraC family transcriptional regulator [Eubacteriales bacterium]